MSAAEFDPARTACAHVDPDLFFATDLDGIAAAKAVCVSCPVAAGCLERHVDLEFGVVGGLTAAERRALRRRARTARSGVGSG